MNWTLEQHGSFPGVKGPVIVCVMDGVGIGRQDGSDAVSDWPLLNFGVNIASGASWVSFHHGGGVGIGFSQHAGQVVVCDGTGEAEARIRRVLTNDPMMGIFRHVDSGEPAARECADALDVPIPLRDWN